MCSKPTVRYQMADGQIGKLACKIKTVFFQRRYSIPDWSLNKKWVYINHLVIKQRKREPGWTNEVVLQRFPSGSINSSSSIASMCCLQTAAITTTRSKIGVIFFLIKLQWTIWWTTLTLKPDLVLGMRQSEPSVTFSTEH